MNIQAETRGFRNNNPGNIKLGDSWEGLSDIQKDKIFCNFTSIEFGIRAIYKILFNYNRLYNINTVEGIISRWAPHMENNTFSYINSVCSRLDIPANEIIDQLKYHKIVDAIIFHENGINPLNLEFIKECEKLI